MPEDAELSDVARGYWVAWHDLKHDRQFGAMGGASQIPWTAIVAYADRQGFHDPDRLARMLWAMDEVYLAWLNEKQKNKDGH